MTQSEMRRRYPKDQKGIKDEWHALVQHQLEMADMIEGYKQELKELKQKDLAYE
jgi:hypothetical protein